MKKLDLLTLGDELLLGLRANSHLDYLGGEFARHGLPLRRNLVVRDEPADIEAAFRDCWQSADIVVTTGGLGPTSDDNTREAIARVLGLPLELDPAAEAAISERFLRAHRTMTDDDRKQCYRPRGAQLLPNRHGTAPGIYLEKDGKILVMLPGPTNELRPMFVNEVLPHLQEAGALQSSEAYLQLRTAGVPEIQVEQRIRPIVNKYPGLGLAFCAHQGQVDVRIAPGARDFGPGELKAIGQEMRAVLDEDFVCFGHMTLAEVVLEELHARGATLALAESCTGGLLANAFTDIPGASEIFLGSVVSYSNDAKVQLLDVPEIILAQHGAVSAETALAMATGAAERIGADYALSITGLAGPTGGTAELPVGTVFLGYTSPNGAWSRKVHYSGDRLTVKARAVHGAIDWMRRKLLKYQAVDLLAASAGSSS
ncbi:MAG TPA: CinA family nicotinamide mononucleotide deamidase-related protein [Opitutales bacterium]|nr:CinA family nicotinamide mononucleotide deamidase-related protein [Opitutales bacterium]